MAFTEEEWARLVPELRRMEETTITAGDNDSEAHLRALPMLLKAAFRRAGVDRQRLSDDERQQIRRELLSMAESHIRRLERFIEETRS
jgi:hypothetical protein